MLFAGNQKTYSRRRQQRDALKESFAHAQTTKRPARKGQRKNCHQVPTVHGKHETPALLHGGLMQFAGQMAYYK